MKWLWYDNIKECKKRRPLVENTLSKKIDTAGQNASYDAYCRNLLVNRQILARILKTCVREFHDCPIKDIEEKYLDEKPKVHEVAVHRDESAEFIDGIGKEDVGMKEKPITYDIYFRVLSPKDDEMIRMIINVESQKDFYPGYPLIKRGIYYCSRMISSQYGTEISDSGYEKLKKVYSIWICFNPPKYRKNTITAYSMKEQNLVGSVTEKEENYDMLSVIAVCLGGPGDEKYEGLLRMLDVLLSDKVLPGEKKKILKAEFDVAMTKTMEREAMEMCNLSQGIVDRTTINHIISMMKKLKLSEEECMDVLGIPEEHRELYHMMLQDKMEVSHV